MGTPKGSPAAYVAFRQTALRLPAADLSKASPRRQQAMVKLGRFLTDNADTIGRSLVEKHWPVTVGATEQPLGAMKNAIYDRRANFKNMQRVEHLLTLAQLKRMGHTDARPWRGTSVVRSADPGLGR